MNVLVTGGGTTAPIDDVRAIMNHSTGRFAASITESWLERGARVWHLHTPNALLPLDRFAKFDLEAADPAAEFQRLGQLRERWEAVRDRLHCVTLPTGTVSEYAEALRGLLQYQLIDVVFLAMAVSDYEPLPHPGKLSSDRGELIVRCHATPKVIQSVRDWSPTTYLVGFKLLSRVSETELISQAEAAGVQNRADLTIANDLLTLTEGRHTVHLVRHGHPTETIGPGDDVADRLVRCVSRWVDDRRSM